MSRPWWAWWAGPGGTGWRRAWPPPAPPPLTHNDKLKWMLNARVLLMISSTILGTSLRMAASWTASVILDSDLTTQCHWRPSTSFMCFLARLFIRETILCAIYYIISYIDWVGTKQKYFQKSSCRMTTNMRGYDNSIIALSRYTVSNWQALGPDPQTPNPIPGDLGVTIMQWATHP